MTRRPGLTLMEVLVTLFILAFGVMAILTLFPLAASQMYIAVREDRTASAANEADAFFRAYWKTEVVERNRDNPPVLEEFFTALDDPNPGAGAFGRGNLTPPAASSDPSYPVLIDPMGYVARAGVGQVWFGDNGGTNLPRRSLRVVTAAPPFGTSGNALFALRRCSLMDGLGYTDQGVPTADRELRYNWLWVVQRTQNATKTAANLTVVVFDNRPHLYTPAGAETVYFQNVPINPETTSVVLPGVADVKPGAWIMDATTNPSGRPKVRQAQFYQVVSATPDANGNTVLELQTPLRTPPDNNPAQYFGTVVLLRGVSGVSVRPQLTSE